MTTPYGDYPNDQPPTGPTAQQDYPSQPYQPYPSQEQPPYQGSYPPPPPQQSYPPYQPQSQAGYAQPYSAQYPQQYAPTPGYPPSGPTSGMAIASLVCSLLGIGLVGVILGHLALNEINKSNGYMQGRGLAIAGLIIGYLQIAAGVIIIILFIIGIAFAANVPTQ